MKSQKMWVILLAAVFTVALAAPMTTTKPVITTRKPVANSNPFKTVPTAALALETQEFELLRDYYKGMDPTKSKEYENKLAPRKLELQDRYATALWSNPKEDETPYSVDPFFKEKQNDEEPKIQKYEEKIKFYGDKIPFKFVDNYYLAKEMGFNVTFRQDGTPRGTPVLYPGIENDAQKFYDNLWKKRNLPLQPFEYEPLRNHWQNLLNQRQALDKKRGPSQAELFAYHKYLNGPKPPGGYTNPPWITTTVVPEKRYVEGLCSKFYGAAAGLGTWCRVEVKG